MKNNKLLISLALVSTLAGGLVGSKVQAADANPEVLVGDKGTTLDLKVSGSAGPINIDRSGIILGK